MSVILEMVSDLVNRHFPKVSRGFHNINCPFCGDRRGRGGFKPSGEGFVYHCFNGGCDYNEKALVWSPEYGLTRRLRSFIEGLGGDPSSIPLEERKPKGKRVDGEERARYDFPEVPLPAGSIPMIKAAEVHESAWKVANEVWGRSPLFFEPPAVDRLLWTPLMEHRVLVPFYYRKAVVGYYTRSYDPSEPRHWMRGNTNYLYDLDHLMAYDRRYLFVVESVLDAILLRGVATMSNRITKNQEMILRSVSSEIVVVPDRDKACLPFVEVAERNGWKVSFPNWNYKDPGEAITNHGLLWTIEKLVESATVVYPKVRAEMKKLVTSK